MATRRRLTSRREPGIVETAGLLIVVTFAACMLIVLGETMAISCRLWASSRRMLRTLPWWWETVWMVLGLYAWVAALLTLGLALSRVVG